MRAPLTRSLLGAYVQACIDQLNVTESLAGLPVFLGSCQQLLVLVGPTYASRLWCVMELFVFVRMNARRKDMIVKLLDETSDLAAGLGTFDAGRAKCFLDEDKQRLWAVIEASFGTFAPFNALVRSIFAERLGAGAQASGAEGNELVVVELCA